MRSNSFAQSFGNALVHRQRMLVPLAVLTTFALASPPSETFGSASLEHLKDLLAFSFALLGLTLRGFAFRADQRRYGWRPFYLANLIILVGIFLMHGHLYVAGFGLAACTLMYALMLGADSGGPAAGVRAGSLPSYRRDSFVGLVLASLKDWRAVVLTISVLLLTEAYEEMPKEGADSVQNALLALSGVLTIVCLASLFVLPRLQVRQGGVSSSPIPLTLVPATRGIRVDGRARAVDFLENAISLGRLSRILDATLDAAALRPNDRLLDVGCGTGRLSIKAASLHAAIHATGIDATPGMIELARENARKTNSPARFQIGVGESLPFADGSMDAVTSSYFFHHLPSDVKRQALREMWRVLAPGGRLVITDYGRPSGLIGQFAALPMRFDFHEYVRGQLSGELEDLVSAEQLGSIERVETFLGYICVLRVAKN